MEGKVYKLEEISGPMLDGFDRDTSIIILPFGILEYHSGHLPYGTDLFETEAITEKMSSMLLNKNPSLKIILYPTIPIGVFGIENLAPLKFPTIGSFVINSGTFERLIIELVENFIRFRFKYVVILSFHGAPEHCAAINRASDEISKVHKISVLPIMNYLFFPLFFGGDYIEKIDGSLKTKLTSKEKKALHSFIHAEAFETSTILYLKPDLVDDSYKTLKPVVFDYDKIFDSVKQIEEWQGYIGIPSEARKEIGEAIINVIGKECAELVLKWFTGKSLEGLTRYPEGLTI